MYNTSSSSFSHDTEEGRRIAKENITKLIDNVSYSEMSSSVMKVLPKGLTNSFSSFFCCSNSLAPKT